MPLEQVFVAVNKASHDLKLFDCGKSSMNEFIHRYALKHSKLGLSRTFVLTESKTSEKAKIAAYYTLAVSCVLKDDIPAKQSLPTYPIPVILLARLAIDNSYQGKGVGAKSLVYALRHAVKLTSSGLPAYGVVLDVLDDQALMFYRQFDFFEQFTNDPMRLFVPMKTLEQL